MTEQINDDGIPSSEAISLPENAKILVGIGGHPAPPNSRLFSYLLPAISLALEARQKPDLVLTSSLYGAQEYNVSSPEERKLIDHNTHIKIRLLREFLTTFFPGAFRQISEYFGMHFRAGDPQKLERIWEKILEIDPGLNDAAQGLVQCTKRSTRDVISYSVLHGLWFQDLVLSEDLEPTYDPEKTHVSIGGTKEGYFNRVRRALVLLSEGFLQDVFQEQVRIHDKIIQVVFETQTPVPYGEATRKRGDKKISAEVTTKDEGCSPLAPHGEKLVADVKSTISHLQKFCGAEEEDFLDFWQRSQEIYRRETSRHPIYN